ncbi:hypothetical protein DMN91_008241 [Ooceraea biroi]|uniref:Scavenger receptor class B member n=1 Tax=Ooceraea biroi TaxID=2015173 RepID=A0A026WYJ8_OOCBI|nr:scavenger receptor class B member 1 [Ooceraea biroi]EZA60923.1 Scavenger receptor class B member [Ooceraea biroi]RLU19684.1 hypothetical protein DMN91_008241 [Ooceraea biroi]
MTLSLADTALDMEKKAMKRCARRSLLCNWLAWLSCGVFLTSFAGFYVTWCTNMYQDYTLTHFELRNGTQAFDWWQQPPFEFTFKVYVFNYTNVDDFEAGRASKLHVQELGPYIYNEKASRVNVVMHQNGTMTYQSKKIYHWVGGRPENDIIVVPNIPLMFATALVRDLNFAMRFSLSTVLSTLHEKPFINVTTGGYVWGYDNPLFEMAKPFIMFQRDIPFEKFGLLAMKNGTENDRITIHTGEDIDKLGWIERVNGMKRRNIWDDEQCDKIGGTDGSTFPTRLIKNSSYVLDVYSKELCRNLPFSFSEPVTVYGMPSLRYKLSPKMFSEDQCFCSKDGSRKVCPPRGLFNMSACNDNAPLLSSFPHFYGGEKSLLEGVDGLNPRQEDHESFIDVHEAFGKPINAWSKFQLNIEVRKAVGVPFLGNLKDRTILPLIWIDIGVDDIPKDLLDTFKNMYYLMRSVEMALQWITVIGMVISLSALITCFWKYREQQHKSFQNSGQKILLQSA